MNPEDDPAIAGGNDSTVDDERRPGTELAARREMLPAELVAPTRAGAIVAEFVNSIVEEAQARAFEMMRAAANEDDHGQREALESADRMRARIDVMAEELEDAVGQLRQESERLAALREQTTAAGLLGTAEPDEREREALAQVAAGLERGASPEEDETPPGPEAAEPEAAEPDEDDESHDVEVVAGHEVDEPEADEEDYPEAIGEAPVEGHAEEEPEPDEEPGPEAPGAVYAEEPVAGEEAAWAEAAGTDTAGMEPASVEPPTPEPDSMPPAATQAEAAAEPAAGEEGAWAEVAPADDDLGGAEPAGEEAADEEDEPGPEERLRFDDSAAQGPPATAEHHVVDPGAVEVPGVPDEPAVAAEAPADEPSATPLSEEEELAQDQERFAKMDDADLAFAYSRALDDMDHQPAESEQGARLLRYAGSALGEALTRPTFADIGQGAPALEKVPRVGRRRRERAEAINTLRRACAQAIEEMSADEAVSPR